MEKVFWVCSRAFGCSVITFALLEAAAVLSLISGAFLMYAARLRAVPFRSSLYYHVFRPDRILQWRCRSMIVVRNLRCGSGALRCICVRMPCQTRCWLCNQTNNGRHIKSTAQENQSFSRISFFSIFWYFMFLLFHFHILNFCKYKSLLCPKRNYISPQQTVHGDKCRWTASSCVSFSRFSFSLMYRQPGRWYFLPLGVT